MRLGVAVFCTEAMSEEQLGLVWGGRRRKSPEHLSTCFGHQKSLPWKTSVWIKLNQSLDKAIGMNYERAARLDEITRNYKWWARVNRLCLGPILILDLVNQPEFMLFERCLGCSSDVLIAFLFHWKRKIVGTSWNDLTPAVFWFLNCQVHQSTRIWIPSVSFVSSWAFSRDGAAFILGSCRRWFGFILLFRFADDISFTVSVGCFLGISSKSSLRHPWWWHETWPRLGRQCFCCWNYFWGRQKHPCWFVHFPNMSSRVCCLMDRGEWHVGGACRLCGILGWW